MKLGKKASEMIINKGYQASSYYTIGVNVLIHSIEYGINDYVLWSWSDEKIVNKSKVLYSKEGNPYFRSGYCGSLKFWLDDFIRV